MLLKKLLNIGINGNMIAFISNFLRTRKFGCMIGNVKELFYVDDLIIFCSGKQKIPRLRKIQVTLSKLESWCNINGFQFSVEKTVAVTFSRKRENRDNIENLTLFNQQIPFCRQHKFLGVILDKSLTFRDHILHIKAKSNKKLNIIKMVIGTNYGSE